MVMGQISEETISLAIRGNMSAFEAIYRELSGFVFNVSLRMTRNREDAEEITQEVFLTLHRKLKDFRGESTLKTWVYRITVNTSSNYAKKHGRYAKAQQQDDEPVEIADEGDLPGKIEEEHAKDTVDRILSVLNEEQKTCVILKDLESLSYEQIAETLGVPIGTVRSRLKRAREKMLASRREKNYEPL